MPRSGRPEEITHWVGIAGGGSRSDRKWLNSPVLDQAAGELVAARRVVEELERAGAGGDPPEQAEAVRDRREGRVGREPQIDPAGIGRDLGVGLDGTAPRDRGANHLLAELIEPGARHRSENDTRPSPGQETDASIGGIRLPTSSAS